MWPFKKRKAPPPPPPPDNLGVYEVPWEKYTHAYGRADDVPRQILELQSSDETVRRTANWQLFGNIYHQGTVYEASQYAVPFLVKLAADPQVSDRDQILLLLACLANGVSCPDVRGESMAEFECRKRVLEAMPFYRTLLVDNQPSVRIAASFVIGALGNDAARERDLLAERARKENDAEVTACLILALASLGVSESILDEMFAVLETRGSDVVTLAHALALIQVTGQNAKAKAIDDAIQALAQPPKLVHDISSATWFDGGVEDLVVSTLLPLGRARLSEFLDEFIALLLSDHRYFPESLVRTVLTISFGDQPYDGDPYKLTTDQKRAIAALFDSNHIIQRHLGENVYFVNTMRILRAYGLPTSADELGALAKLCR